MSVTFGIKSWLWYKLLSVLGEPPPYPKHQVPSMQSRHNHLQEELMEGLQANEMNFPGSTILDAN